MVSPNLHLRQAQLTESEPSSSSLQKLKPVTAVLEGGKTSDLIIDNHLICAHRNAYSQT